MIRLKSILFSLLFVFVFSAFAQNMNQGFDYLETGQYLKAEDYFETILQEYPENKTARLCYGRAVGLNGDSEKAFLIFTTLLNDHPDDFEVKLNYGESLLWDSQFDVAKTYYANLVNEAPENFSALLGYANTLSNLKEFDKALIFVENALNVQPKNENAMTSKKYIYLGYAYQNQLQQNYDKAELLLTKNLELLGEDKETLLNLANLYLIWNKLEVAQSTYERLGENVDNRLESLNGLALVSHLNEKDKDALQISKQAFISLTTETNTELKQQTTERYVQALIWNRKFKQAKTLIDALHLKTPNKNWILALRATLNVYKSNFKKSLEDYNLILENDSTSFDGNLGKANTLKALGYYDEAYNAAEKTLSIYDNQKDALNFIDQLNSKFTPALESRVAYTFDNGDNNAYYLNTSVVYPVSTKFSILGNYNYRNTTNTFTKSSATSNDLSLGFSYQLLNNIIFKGTAGLTSAKAESNDYSQVLTDVSFSIKPYKLQNLDIGYKREVQSFNADLLDREIIQNNFYTNYNLSTNFNLGWFTQFMYTSQNDGNNRNLLFTSLYYNLLRKPSLKVGLNYQYITFKNQVPNIYFSPEQFNAGEVFLNLIKDENTAKTQSWFYELTAATGVQFIENDESQTTYRFQGKIGYKFSKRSMLNLYGTHSNIASATAAGFTFTEIGLRFKWRLFEGPVFRD